MDTAVYWIWLQRALGVGAHQSEAILQQFSTVQDIYNARQYPGETALHAIQLKRLANKDLAAATKEWERLQECGAWILTPEDELYTALFEGMYAPPVVLYAKGHPFALEDVPRIAMVGTRHHDETGRCITRKLAAGLAAAGAVIVSGGALGLDSEALDAALCENGKCLSFQACGIDVDYPRANASLRRRLLENGGMLLTEFPLGLPAYRHHFRVRNRLISACTDGTLVTQAPLGSGALITAAWAREQGKDVFAVPGAVGIHCCEGSNELLKDGAQFVTNAADILSAYLSKYPFSIHIAAAAAAEQRALQVDLTPPGETPPTVSPVGDRDHIAKRVAQEPPEQRMTPCPDDASDNAKQLHALLKEHPKTVTELALASALSPSDVLSALTELELYGAVSCTAGQQYCLM